MAPDEALIGQQHPERCPAPQAATEQAAAAAPTITASSLVVYQSLGHHPVNFVPKLHKFPRKIAHPVS